MAQQQAQMQKLMQLVQQQQAQMQELARAQIDAISRTDQAKADAAAAQALAAAHANVKHNGWWELGHFAVAAAPVVMTALQIYHGRPLDPKTVALYQLGNSIVAPYFTAPAP